MAKKRKPGALYFTDVARAGSNSVILVGNYYALEGKTEQRIALLSFKNGVWGGIDLAGVAHAVRLQDSKKGYLVLERNRAVYSVLPPDQLEYTKIDENREGFLMDVRRIGAHWYAVGGHHQIYRGEGTTWIAFDDDVYVPGEDGETKMLLSVDGSSESDIYAVGFDGMILHYDGKAWTAIDCPTNVGLQRVLCVGSDEVYICGNGNTLIRGSVQGWTPLTEPDESITFWDLAYFRGEIYVCTKHRLFKLVDDQLEVVEIPVKGPLGFYRMDSDEKELWTCGNECLLQFDGRTWTQHVFPDNA